MMGEFKYEVRTYIVDMSCPQCGVGRMRPTNEALTTYPVQYPHFCTECGYKGIYFKAYPYTETEKKSIN